MQLQWLLKNKIKQRMRSIEDYAVGLCQERTSGRTVSYEFAAKLTGKNLELDNSQKLYFPNFQH